MTNYLLDGSCTCEDCTAIAEEQELAELRKLKTAAEAWEKVRLPDDAPRGRLFHPDFVAWRILSGKGPEDDIK